MCARHAVVSFTLTVICWNTKHSIMLNICVRCGKKFPSCNGMKRHSLTAHKKVFKFSCETCGQQFADKSHYEGHTDRHNNLNPFSCSKCGKSYPFCSSKTKHERSCTGDRAECKACKKRFTSKDGMKDHERAEHGDERLFCRCGKSYAWRKRLYEIRIDSNRSCVLDLIESCIFCVLSLAESVSYLYLIIIICLWHINNYARVILNIHRT